MVFRDFLARLGGRRELDTEGIDPSVPPRPRSQLGIRSSKSTPPTVRRRRSDGKQNIRFISDLSLQFELGATGGTTSQIPSVSDHHIPAPNVDESKPAELSSYIVDPTAAYENKPNWKSTLYASAGLVIDIVKESSDAFTPLKSVAGGLSAILKHYDVQCSHFAKPFAPLTFEPASDGEPRNDRITNTPGRRPRGITQRTRS